MVSLDPLAAASIPTESPERTRWIRNKSVFCLVSALRITREQQYQWDDSISFRVDKFKYSNRHCGSLRRNTRRSGEANGEDRHVQIRVGDRWLLFCSSSLCVLEIVGIKIILVYLRLLPFATSFHFIRRIFSNRYLCLRQTFMRILARSLLQSGPILRGPNAMGRKADSIVKYFW